MISRLPLILFILVSAIKADAQCCSPGNPSGGSENAGVLEKQVMRVMISGRYSHSDHYYSGSKPFDFNFMKNTSYSFTGLSLGYGLTSRLTTEAELGYFIEKKQRYNIEPEFSLRSSGFSNSTVSLKYAVLGDKRKTELALGAGFKFPFTTTLMENNNVTLPYDIQPSTLATGLMGHLFLKHGFSKSWKAFVVNRTEYNMENRYGYHYGMMVSTSIIAYHELNERWSIVGHLRNDIRTRDIRDGQPVTSSGSNIIFAIPQVNYSWEKLWTLSALGEIPVFRYYNGIQMANSYSCAISLSRHLNFKDCTKPEDPRTEEQ